MSSGSPDPRFAFLTDRDLQDVIWRMARKRTRNRTDADDVRNGAFALAMRLVVAGKGPAETKRERGWMCQVLRSNALSAWRKEGRDGEPPRDPTVADE